MKRIVIIQKIIAIFTRKPDFSVSTDSIKIEESSPITTIASIPNNNVERMAYPILSHQLVVLRTTWLK